MGLVFPILLIYQQIVNLSTVVRQYLPEELDCKRRICG